MRERAFAVLGDLVEGARFLDLFAGTGAVGLEALSRGARRGGVCRASPRSRPHPQAKTALSSTSRTNGPRSWSNPPLPQSQRWRGAARPSTSRGPTPHLKTGRKVSALSPPRFKTISWRRTRWRVWNAPKRAVGRRRCCPTDLEVFRDLGGGASRVVLIRRSKTEPSER